MANDVTLREYIERILDEREKHGMLALELASREIERRLEALNELRSEVIKDRIMLVRVDTYDSKMKDLDAWRKRVDTAITKIDTRSTTWTAALAIAFIIVQLILAYFRI